MYYIFHAQPANVTSEMAVRELKDSEEIIELNVKAWKLQWSMYNSRYHTSAVSHKNPYAHNINLFTSVVLDVWEGHYAINLTHI